MSEGKPMESTAWPGRPTRSPGNSSAQQYPFYDGFCGDAFWDSDLSWNTHNPDLTLCFQKTILVWLPCWFLWLMIPLHIYLLSRSNLHNHRWTWNSLTKMIVALILVVVSMTDLTTELYKYSQGPSGQMPHVDIIAPAMKLISFFVGAVFIYTDKRRARTADGPLFFFWLLFTLCESLIFASAVRNASLRGISDSYIFVIRVIYLPLVFAELILSSVGDNFTANRYVQPGSNPCPEVDASFPGLLTLWWFDKMAYLGWKKPLEQHDMYDTQPVDAAASVVEPVERFWAVEMDKYRRSKGNNSKSVYRPSILKALLKTHWRTLLGTVFVRLLADMSTFITPLVLQLLIRFVSNPAEEAWKGYLYASLMLLAAIISSISSNWYMYRCFRVGMNGKAAVVAAVYKKALKITSAVKQASSVGEMVNLISVDSQRFMEFMGFAHMLWSCPLQLILAMYFLYTVLGYAAFAGVITILLTLPINAFAFSHVKQLQNAQMQEKDKRIKLMTEMLTGIKVLKLYAWEEAFEQEILKIRARELHVLKKSAYYAALSYTLFCMIPFFVALACFATYVLSEGNNLDPETVFVALSLMNIIRSPITMMSPAVMMTIQMLIAEKRVSKFLKQDELDLNNVQSLPATSPYSLAVEKGTFTWNEEDAVTLNKIDMVVPDGKLVAVVGQVGSGKSSLCSAVIGLMEKKGGSVGIKGTLAYVPQQAWIQNLTVQENILFGKPMNRPLYDQVIKACALQPDLESFASGDLTEIGERGTNLSGGQRQRISLARATYSMADVYIFDDPLSAVDAHVGKHIFEHVIGPKGMLKQKTRMLVTHGISFLPHVDQIVVLNHGTVSETGSYKELLHRKGAFAEFLMTYLEEEKEETQNDPEVAAVKDSLLDEIGANSLAPLLVPRRNSNYASMKKVQSVLRQASRISTTKLDEATKKDKEDKAKGEEKGRLVEEEKAQTGMVKWNVYFMFFRQMTWLVVFVMIFFFVTFSSLGMGANFWLNDWALDASLEGRNTTEWRDYRLGIYGLFGVLQVFFVAGFAIALVQGRVTASRHLHQNLLFRILRRPMSFFDTTPLGRIVNRFSKDVDTVDVLIPGNLEFWLYCNFSVFSTLVVITINLPPFAAVLVPLALFYFFMQRFYISTSRQLKRIESITRSPIYSHFQESLSGAGVILASKELDRFVQTNERMIDVNTSSNFLILCASRWISVRLELIGGMVTFLTSLFGVIGRDQNWGVSPEKLGLSISYALTVSAILNWLIWVTSELESNIVSVERIKEYTEVPQEAAWHSSSFKPPQNWPTEGRVVFQDYQTRYRPGLELVLKGLSAHIESGEKVGIVGRTGAGKSSLTLSLFRIIEATNGRIMIDDIDVARMGLHDVRSRITILPQEPVLFTGTLRLNLDPFKKYTDEEIWHALDHSHLRNFVSALPEGLQHNVVDGGENYSVGQRQLICLARALLRKTKILVLDETTAAIDLQTDDLIQKTIREQFAECTVLTIAHRINTIMDSTRIMVLDQGRVKEFDSPATLLQDKEGLFYGLAKESNLVA